MLAGVMIAWLSHDTEPSETYALRARLKPITFEAWWTAIRSGYAVAISFALYNVAFILLTSFSPAFLTSEGFAAQIATTISSLPMWLFIVSVPLGGVLAGKFVGHERALVALGCFGSAVALILAMICPHKLVWYLVAGVLGGLPTAPMWAGASGRGEEGPSAQHLTYPALFLIFFASLLVFPPIVGAMIQLTDDAGTALIASSAMLVFASLVFFAGQRRVVRAPRSAS
jgi:hypothetical protein